MGKNKTNKDILPPKLTKNNKEYKKVKEQLSKDIEEESSLDNEINLFDIMQKEGRKFEVPK